MSTDQAGSRSRLGVPGHELRWQQFRVYDVVRAAILTHFLASFLLGKPQRNLATPKEGTSRAAGKSESGDPIPKMSLRAEISRDSSI